MSRKRTGSLSSAAMLLAGAMAGGMMDTPAGRLFRECPEEEPKGPPRQPEVDQLSRRARKVYAKVLRETQDREAALKAAKEKQ
jgi:hypothetical protein